MLGAVLLCRYKALPIHFPGPVLADTAVAIGDGANSTSDLAVLRDHPRQFGPVASTPTVWRVLDATIVIAHPDKQTVEPT